LFGCAGVIQVNAYLAS